MPDFRDERIAARALEIAERTKKIGDDGKVSFSGWEFFGALKLLQDCVTFHPEVPSSEGKRIVWKSLTECARTRKITPASFLEKTRANESMFLAQEKVPYILVTELSANRVFDLHGIRRPAGIVTIPRSLPRRFLSERQRLLKEARSSLLGSMPNCYRWVRVRTEGRSMDEAAQKALRALDLVRAAWNLAVNIGKWDHETINGKRKPVNSFLLGPVHTVHRESGEIESDRWWYEPNYCGPIEPIMPKSSLEDNIHRFQRGLFRKLPRIPYREDVEEMLRRYTDALDERAWEVAFLKLWSALEFETGNPQNFRDVVRRTVFLYKNADWHRALLNDLRLRRNDMVHAGEWFENIEMHLYLLKNYVERLLFFHFDSGPQFRTLTEAGEFLTLPPGSTDLSKRLRHCQLALEFKAQG